MTENLIDGLNRELERNRELLKQYKALGPCGNFGAAFIQQAISEGESALSENDAVDMVKAYAKLKDMK